METARYWIFDRLRFEADTHHLAGPGGEVTLEPRVAELLEVFLEHPGEVLSHDFLIEAVWQGRVVSDEAVRRGVSNLRHSLAICGADNQIRTVRKTGYVSQFNPQRHEGLGCSPRSDPADSPRPARRQQTRFTDGRRVVLMATLLVLAVAFSWRFFQLTEDNAGEQTEGIDALPIPLAVLPFNNLVPNSGDDSLSDSMAEELISRLAHVDAFRVTARSSSFQFRGDGVDPRAVGDALGVRYLVEGSVRREVGNLRVSAALVDVHSGFQAWAGSYDRDSVAGLFTVQEEIAREVARALQVVLVRDTRHRAVSSARHAEARLAYARGQALMSSWVQADIEAAMVELRRAIELDASFAPAYVRLARAMTMRAHNMDFGEGRRQSAKAAARPLVEKALELNPGMGAAYVVRSELHAPDDLASAERDLRKGLQLNPSYAEGYEQLANLLFQQGKVDESAAMVDQAIALDPLRPRNYHFKTYIEFQRCDTEAVEALSEKALSLNPRFRASLVQLARVRRSKGRVADSLHYLERALALDDSQWIRTQIALDYMLLGQAELAWRMNQPPDPKADVALHALAGDDHALAAALYRFLKSRQGADFGPLTVTRLAYRAARATGDWQRFIALLGQHFPSLQPRDGGLPRIESLGDRVVPAYLHLLLLHGGEERNRAVPANVLDELALRLQAIRSEGRGCKSHLPEIFALIALFRGDSQGAMAALRRGADGGELGFWGWRQLAMDPAYASLRTAPGFIALGAEFDRRAATEWARYQAGRNGRSGLVSAVGEQLSD